MISRGSLILGIARDALATQRVASDVAAHNIANVSTPGYARARAELEAVALGLGRGQGVRVSTLSHARSLLHDQAAWGAQSQQDGAALARELAELGELALATPGAPTLSDALSDFFGALRAAEAAPADLAARRQVLDRAQALAHSFGRAAQGLDAARATADAQLVDATTQANQALARIAALNAEIRGLEGTGTPALDQRNARAQAVQALAAQIAVEVSQEGDGSLRVTLAGGPTLVEGERWHSLSAARDATTGLLQVRAQTSTAVHQLSAGSGGRIGAALAQRDGTLTALAGGLDQLAWDLAGAVNAAHAAGVGLDGIGGRDLLDAGASATGAARNLALAAALVDNPSALGFAANAGALPGDNRQLSVILAVQDQALGSGLSAGQAAGALLGQAGVAMQAASAEYDDASARLAQASALRESVQGVSLEDELIAQAQAQRAFEAAAKLVAIADEMFSTVLDMVQR